MTHMICIKISPFLLLQHFSIYYPVVLCGNIRPVRKLQPQLIEPVDMTAARIFYRRFTLANTVIQGSCPQNTIFSSSLLLNSFLIPSKHHHTILFLYPTFCQAIFPHISHFRTLFRHFSITIPHIFCTKKESANILTDSKYFLNFIRSYLPGAPSAPHASWC